MAVTPDDLQGYELLHGVYVIQNPDNVAAWLQSDTYRSLDDVR